MQKATVDPQAIIGAEDALRKECRMLGGDPLFVKVMGYEKLERYKRTLLSDLMGGKTGPLSRISEHARYKHVDYD